MSKSLTELTELLGIPKPSLSRKISSIHGFREKYTSKAGNRLIISDEGVEVLSKSFKNHNKSINRNVDVNDFVNLLKEQLKVKDKQISEKDEQINHEQQLRLAADNRVDELNKKLLSLETSSVNNEELNNSGKEVHDLDSSNSSKTSNHWWSSFFRNI